jgi:GT2 family glycosyltransferase
MSAAWICETGEQPDITIVMPFYNRAEHVAECLDSILQQHVPGRKVELIAVDNASTDNTAQELARFPVRLIRCERPGPAAARNAGWKAARAPIVVFFDSDCVAEPNWLMRLVATFENPAVLFSGGAIRPRSIATGAAYFTDIFRILDNEKFFEGQPFFPPYFATANAAFRRDVLEQTGGFDEKIWMSEDADLCWRCLELGGQSAYCAEAIVYHEHRDNITDLYKQANAYGAAAVQLFARHRSKFRQRASVSWENIRVLARLPADIIFRFATEPRNFDRVAPIYYAVWTAGFTLGCIRGSLREHVVYV